MEDVLKKMQAEKLIEMINGMLIVVGIEARVILPKPNPTCENCKYYQDISGWGYCKFNPPFTKKGQRQKYYNGMHSDLIEDVLHTEWTKVSNYDWCGQFEQREA